MALYEQMLLLLIVIIIISNIILALRFVLTEILERGMGLTNVYECTIPSKAFQMISKEQTKPSNNRANCSSFDTLIPPGTRSLTNYNRHTSKCWCTGVKL